MKITVAKIIKELGTRKLDNGLVIYKFKVQDAAGKNHYVEAFGQQEADLVKEGATIECNVYNGRYGEYLRPAVSAVRTEAQGGTKTMSTNTSGGTVGTDRELHILWANALNVSAQFLGCIYEQFRTSENLLALAHVIFNEGVRLFGLTPPVGSKTTAVLQRSQAGEDRETNTEEEKPF